MCSSPFIAPGLFVYLLYYQRAQRLTLSERPGSLLWPCRPWPASPMAWCAARKRSSPSPASAPACYCSAPQRYDHADVLPAGPAGVHARPSGDGARPEWTRPSARGRNAGIVPVARSHQPVGHAVCRRRTRRPRGASSCAPMPTRSTTPWANSIWPKAATPPRSTCLLARRLPLAQAGALPLPPGAGRLSPGPGARAEPLADATRLNAHVVYELQAYYYLGRALGHGEIEEPRSSSLHGQVQGRAGRAERRVEAAARLPPGASPASCAPTCAIWRGGYRAAPNRKQPRGSWRRPTQRLSF